MTHAKFRIPTPLRSFTGGADEVEVEASTVGQALTSLCEKHSGLSTRVLDKSGNVRSFVNIYLGEKNIKSLQGLDTALQEGAVMAIVPAVAGGRS